MYRHPSHGRRSKLDDGLFLRPPFRQQAVPANRSKNLAARATQVLRHSIHTCVLSPTHDVNPRYHHPLSRPAQFYGFLRRSHLTSRSAPKKRRSRSANEIAEMAEPLQSTIPLANGGHSVQDHGRAFILLPIKHSRVIASSRPLPTATVAQKHLDKKLPQLPPNATTSTHQPIMISAHVISEPEHPKHEKRHFLG